MKGVPFVADSPLYKTSQLFRLFIYSHSTWGLNVISSTRQINLALVSSSKLNIVSLGEETRLLEVTSSPSITASHVTNLRLVVCQYSGCIRTLGFRSLTLFPLPSDLFQDLFLTSQKQEDFKYGRPNPPPTARIQAAAALLSRHPLGRAQQPLLTCVSAEQTQTLRSHSSPEQTQTLGPTAGYHRIIIVVCLFTCLPVVISHVFFITMVLILA